MVDRFLPPAARCRGLEAAGAAAFGQIVASDGALVVVARLGDRHTPVNIVPSIISFPGKLTFRHSRRRLEETCNTLVGAAAPRPEASESDKPE